MKTKLTPFYKVYLINCVLHTLCVSFRGTDEVFQALEDNQVILSTMKASRFVKAFETEVDGWERQLSQVLEVTEMILTVQRQWIYLEVIFNFSLNLFVLTCAFQSLNTYPQSSFFPFLQNIFQGKDIREQLPAECKEFEEASCSWKTIMSRLHKENKALQGTHHPGRTT